MKIIVKKGNWGTANTKDIFKVLKNTVSHIEKHLRKTLPGVIYVEHWFKKPRSVFRNSPDDPYTIKLNARNDNNWPQFAFQFAHEFCHVLSGNESLRENPNNWFHEAICELASIFALNRMAEQWSKHPPLLHKRRYAARLGSYVKNRLANPEKQLPEGMTLHGWMLNHEDGLYAKCPYQRKKNDLVAYQMLPVFEEIPSGWNAVRRLPNSHGRLAEYFVDWHAKVEPLDKPFVKHLASLFDFHIPD